MFKRILVPTDLTDKSQDALEVAARMAVGTLSSVTLLHVIETIADTDYDEFQDFYERLRERAERIMEEMTGRYQAENLNIARQIAFGRRVAEIVGFAREHHIDLIVLSSHPVEWQGVGPGWGTISYKVGILSHCPILLVK